MPPRSIIIDNNMAFIENSLLDLKGSFSFNSPHLKFLFHWLSVRGLPEANISILMIDVT